MTMAQSWVFWIANLVTGLCIALWVKVVWLGWAKLPASEHPRSVLVVVFLALPLVQIWKALYQSKEEEARSLLFSLLSLSLAVSLLLTSLNAAIR